MSAKQPRKPNTISVIILDKENAVKYIPAIRKWTKRSITEIKERILNDNYILVSEYNADVQSLIELQKQIHELEEKGAEVKITMNIADYSENIDSEMISTLIKRNKQTEKEVDELMDLEARAMEEED